jgi:hypothetical protein
MNDILKTAGRSGNAGSLKFIDTNSDLIYTPLLTLSSKQNVLSYSFWLKNEASTTINSIISTGNQSSTLGFIWIYITSDKRLIVQVADINSFRSFIMTRVIDSQWIHFSITVDYTNKFIDFYQDGIFIKRDDGSSSPVFLFPDRNNRILFGSYNGALFNLNGYLQDMKIYDRLLHQNEVKLLSQCLPISRVGLVGEWKLNEMGGTTAYDTSGNGNHCTIARATYSTDKPS